MNGTLAPNITTVLFELFGVMIEDIFEAAFGAFVMENLGGYTGFYDHLNETAAAIITELFDFLK